MRSCSPEDLSERSHRSMSTSGMHFADFSDTKLMATEFGRSADELASSLVVESLHTGYADLTLDHCVSSLALESERHFLLRCNPASIVESFW